MKTFSCSRHGTKPCRKSGLKSAGWDSATRFEDDWILSPWRDCAMRGYVASAKARSVFDASRIELRWLRRRIDAQCAVRTAVLEEVRNQRSPLIWSDFENGADRLALLKISREIITC